MDRDADRHKLISRRMFMLAAGNGILISTLAGRLYYLQVLESERYSTLADENRVNLRLLPPPRGRIVDRLGRPVAVNRQDYRVFLIAEQANDVETTLRALGSLVEIGDSERNRVLKELKRKRKFVPVTVRDGLDWETVARIEVNAPDLPGISIGEGQSRHYPQGETAAHLVGYVAAVSERELTGDPLLEIPDFRIGKAGVENSTIWPCADRAEVPKSRSMPSAG